MAWFGRSLRVSIIAAALFVGVIAAAARGHAFGGAGRLDQADIAAITLTVQSVRGLRLQRPVGLIGMTPQQAAARLSNSQSGPIADDVPWARSRVGAMLGLFAKETDLRTASLRTYESQLLAFYDFHARQMVVVNAGAWHPVASTLATMIVAHEMTHALQDQNFALGDQLDSLRGDADRQLALRAVAEGDATFVGWASATGRLNPGPPTTTASGRDDATRALMAHAGGDAVAAYEYFNFPYVQGLRFVAEAYRRGGWLAVNALYANPPQSTQQIIDPSLYFDRPTLPDRVNLAGYDRALDGWTTVAHDTYGELGMRVILERSVGNNGGTNSRIVHNARDWAGDRMVILRRGDDLVVIWMIAFRGAGAAHRFANVYTGVLERIDGATTPHRVAAMGSVVLVIAGPPAHDGILARSIWKASTIAPQRTVRGREIQRP
jgi:hypothetical protein